MRLEIFKPETTNSGALEQIDRIQNFMNDRHYGFWAAEHFGGSAGGECNMSVLPVTAHHCP